jgi:diacylglycerol kinase family enzyme
MYYYIYDTFLADKKYEKTLDKIKASLLDLEIQGKHEKLTLLKSVDELIHDELKRGTKTIVVIGNDKTFLKVIDTVGKNNATLGLIPIGPENNIAKCLGIPEEEGACEVLAARKVVKFDLGKANEQYFFSNLRISKNLDRISVHKDKYKVVPRASCSEFDVYNFYFPEGKQSFERKMKKYSAQDEKVELVIRVPISKKGWFGKKDQVNPIDTIIQGESFKIKSFEYLPVLLDDYRVIKTPVSVDIAPQKLKVIVGKNRLKCIN